MYKRLVRLWLIAILLILPFQLAVATYIGQWSGKLSTLVNNLEEITIVAFLILASGEYYRQKLLSDKIFFFCFIH